MRKIRREEDKLRREVEKEVEKMEVEKKLKQCCEERRQRK